MSVPECPVCLETMNKPHALPCMHNVCADCAPKLVHGKRTRCPECRRWYFSRYRPNYALADAYETMRTMVVKPPPAPRKRRWRLWRRRGARVVPDIGG
jgi:hypothetical protein